MNARRRRLAHRMVAMVGLSAVASVLVVGLAYLVARDDLHRGARAFRAAETASRAGDLDLARTQFRVAERAFADAAGAPTFLSVPGRLVPGVAQQVRAGTQAIDIASTASRSAQQAARDIRLDQLEVRGGVVDLDAVASAADPADRLVSDLQQVVMRLARIDRSLLVGPLSDAVGDALDDAMAAGRDAERLRRAIHLAPDLLGGDGVRRYLVLFSTPVESRNRFGFPGTYTLVRFDEGAFSFERSGPINELFRGQRPIDQSVLGLPARAQSYQPFGVSREWRNVTIPAHFPAVADLAAQLALQSPLGEVDGVILAGPETAAAMVGLVGDVEVEEVGVTLDEETTVEFVTRRQYLEFPEPGDGSERRDLLADIADTVGRRLETVDLPPLGELLGILSPLVRADQLAVSIPAGTSAEAAALLAELSLDGGMPSGSGDLVHVGNVNSGGSKIDLFLRRTLEYDVTIDDLGTLSAQLTITLENRAPAAGLPPYLIGSTLGPEAIPSGTNRTTVLLYSPHRLVDVTVDGRVVPVVALADADLFVYQLQVDLAARSTSTVIARYEGSAPDGAYRVQVLPNGLVTPDRLTVRVDDQRTDGPAERTLRVRERRELVVR